MAAALKPSTTPQLLLHLGARHARRSAAAAPPPPPRRTLTTAAEDAAQQIQATFRNQPPTTRHQTLDGHQLQRLSLTLNRPHLHPGLDVTSAPPPAGTPLPPGYHLAYFTPATAPAAEADLAPDGTDATFNAPPPFSRRMWAGGTMRWVPGAGPLRVGEAVQERTRLVGAVAKRSRGAGAGGGGEMVLVEVEKEFWGGAGLALVDRRTWVFRPPLPLPLPAGASAGVVREKAGAAGSRGSSMQDVVGVDGTGEL